MSHAVTSDLTALGHLEWRFTGDERNTDQGFNETRQSYIGLSSKQYGTLLEGNFNSIYAQFVSLPFDVYQDRGLLFKSSGLQSWGDSIAYYTPELNGFTSFLQVKHYSERGLTPAEQSGDGSDVAAQGGIRYQQGPFTIGFGAVENAVRGGGSGMMKCCMALLAHTRYLTSYPCDWVSKPKTTATLTERGSKRSV
jgi:predicted porin